MNEITTEHNLEFCWCRHELYGPMFKIGTCEGIWNSTKDAYVIVSIVNDVPGNGHLNDTLAWFEHSCKRDSKNLLIVDFFNPNFKSHLLRKRGFIELPENHVIKVFNDRAYRLLKKKGNEMMKVNNSKLYTI